MEFWICLTRVTILDFEIIWIRTRRAHLDCSAAIGWLLLHPLPCDRPWHPFHSREMSLVVHHLPVRRCYRRHRWSIDHFAGRPDQRMTTVFKITKHSLRISSRSTTYLIVRFRQIADLSFQWHDYDLERHSIDVSLCSFERTDIFFLSLFFFFLCSHASSFDKQTIDFRSIRLDPSMCFSIATRWVTSSGRSMILHR